MSGVPCNRRICLKMIDLPDSSGPNNKYLIVCVSLTSCLALSVNDAFGITFEIEFVVVVFKEERHAVVPLVVCRYGADVRACAVKICWSGFVWFSGGRTFDVT